MQANISAYRELFASKFNKRALLRRSRHSDVSGFEAEEGKEQALPQHRKAAASILILIIHY